MPLELQGVAVLGIALIAMGEEIGAEMALRTFGHLVSSTEYTRIWCVCVLLGIKPKALSMHDV